jgi:hypothetical protein
MDFHGGSPGISEDYLDPFPYQRFHGKSEPLRAFPVITAFGDIVSFPLSL